MDQTMMAIADRLRRGEQADAKWLDVLLRQRNRETRDPDRRIAKRRLLPYYLHERDANSPAFRRWRIDEAMDDAIVSLLRAKPRRTASGVATVTVLTKPWPCSSRCVYCPNDIRMPKSYLSREPACQRAERCWFDPYLQVAARMRVLSDMGHNTDKVELIVLGGTWSEYPENYRVWFIRELFRCLNDIGTSRLDLEIAARVALYEEANMPSDPDEIACMTRELQAKVDTGELDYNDALHRLERSFCASEDTTCTYADLEREQTLNESAAHRNVGLVVETRPDLVTREHLTHLRRLGCTKIQMGIQSLDAGILAKNCRTSTPDDIGRAFELLREFGFKSHVHLMVNLLEATPATDKADFMALIGDARLKPDEIKLYPCALVESADLMRAYESGRWRPYSEEELLDVLVHDVIRAPSYMRISRMIRDISSDDIVAGNRKTNLRQMVERCVDELASRGEAPLVQEMRMREIGTCDVDPDDLVLDVIEYDTSNTTELFLQHVTSDYRLAAFLRLSLPSDRTHGAMIREVHVYGKVSKLHESKEGTQHTGLGRSLVDEACRIASMRGYDSIRVISAIGTRGYYRSLGFCDDTLYQCRSLAAW